jgi:hypothetical protein
MGRVSRYRRVKTFDPLGSSSSRSSGRHGGRGAAALDLDAVGVWGLGSDGRRPKKVSRTVLKIRAQKEKKSKKNKSTGAKLSSERRDVLDAAYEGEDDFDLSDPVGTLRRVVPPPSSLTSSSSAAPSSSREEPFRRQAGGAEANNRKEDCVPDDPRGVGGRNEDKEVAAEEEEDQDAEEEEERLVRRLGLGSEAAAANNSRNSVAGGRMPGESKNAFRKRAALETRQIIKRTRLEQCNPEKRRRRKEFLDNKKKKKRKKGAGAGLSSNTHGGSSDDDDDGTDHRTFSDGGHNNSSADGPKMRIVFGEQVEAPPVFRQRPRGAIATAPGPSAAATSDKTKGTVGANTRSMTGDEIAAEQAAMEAIRRKAQAHYSLVKARRRQEGSFHL